MNILNFRFIIKGTWFLFALLLTLSLLSALFLFFLPIKDDRAIGLIGGLTAGFLIAAVQFFAQFFEQKKLAEYSQQGLVKFLTNRKDTTYYRKLIKDAQRSDKITVMGVTCNRLLDDFANPSVEKSQDLLEALSRGVEVRLLLPKIKYLKQKNKSDFENKTLKMAETIKAKYGEKFAIKYYDFEPSHSIFLAGSKFLAGPIFKDIDSKDTPTIVFEKTGSYVKPYLEYLSKTWDDAEDSYE